MYICICAAVTDRQIRAEVENGVSSLDELGIELGVALGCGTCACAAEALICETQQRLACQQAREEGYTPATRNPHPVRSTALAA